MSEFTCFPHVHIISDTKSSISEEWITAVAKQSLKPYKFIRDCELNIVIADDKLLKSLNFKIYDPWIIVIETHLKTIEQIMQSEIYLYLEERMYTLKSWTIYSLIFVKKD